MVEAAGRPPEDLDQALARLEDAVLGGPRELTATDVARLAGVEPAELDTFWNALGLRLPEPGEPAFTAADVAVVSGFIGAGHEFDLSPAAGVSLVRAMGHTMERLVSWQTETIVEHLATKYGLRDAAARGLLLERLLLIDDLLAQGLVHAWRRHLAAAAARAGAVAARGARDDSDELPLARAVGLADVVGFTSARPGSAPRRWPTTCRASRRRRATSSPHMAAG